MATLIRSIRDMDLSGRRVFIRVDFNVPQDKKDPSIITNTARCVPPTSCRQLGFQACSWRVHRTELTRPIAP